MTDATQAVLRGDGPEVRIDLAEARRMATALAAALADREMVQRSGAPEPLKAQLAENYDEVGIDGAGQVRAGQWLLVSMPDGPRWDFRLATPEGSRVGLIFQVPLVREQQGWRARSVDFLRARSAPGR